MHTQEYRKSKLSVIKKIWKINITLQKSQISFGKTTSKKN